MSKMSWLFWGAGALVAWYLIKNAGKGALPPMAVDEPGQDILPPSGVQ